MSRWRSATTRCTTSSPIAGQLAGALATARRNASRALTSRGGGGAFDKTKPNLCIISKALGLEIPRPLLAR